MDELVPILPAPTNPGRRGPWRAFLQRWRDERRRELRYDDSLYERLETEWTRRCFAVGFVMLWDEALLDPRTGRFGVDEFLAREEERFGGHDAVVLWQAYPRLGFDDRNQFDFIRDLPGGLPGARALVGAFQERGVRVFIAFNPWDTATRREPVSDAETLLELAGLLDVDGLYLDTLATSEAGFRERLDRAGSGVVVETEVAPPLARVHDHQLSWAQWFEDSHAPGVLRNKWFERRHMMHVIARYNTDRSGELHTAWMNGAGVVVWENVFGSWVGWSERDRSLLRSMLPIQRRYAQLFIHGSWTPVVDTLARGSIYATLWELAGVRLWTLVNRSTTRVSEPLLEVAHEQGQRYFDLIAGCEIAADSQAPRATLVAAVGGRGIGALLAVDESQVDGALLELLAAQAQRHGGASADASFPRRMPSLRPVASTKRYAEPPTGMVAVAACRVELTSTYRERECGMYDSTALLDTVYVNFYDERYGAHARIASLSALAIDARPVTNADFAGFLRESGYQPRHPERFLAHWRDGAPAGGEEESPVTYVDLDDARAFAAWAGKRLPTEEEWQHAMQRHDLDHGDPRVWNWTESERSDGRTRFCVLKGGAAYCADGSVWYADGGPKPPEFAAKFILTWPGLDRCATIGFRCVVDLEERRG